MDDRTNLLGGKMRIRVLFFLFLAFTFSAFAHRPSDIVVEADYEKNSIIDTDYLGGTIFSDGWNATCQLSKGELGTG